jgi:hypothetical protein
MTARFHLWEQVGHAEVRRDPAKRASGRSARAPEAPRASAPSATVNVGTGLSSRTVGVTVKARPTLSSGRTPNVFGSSQATRRARRDAVREPASGASLTRSSPGNAVVLVKIEGAESGSSIASPFLCSGSRRRFLHDSRNKSTSTRPMPSICRSLRSTPRARPRASPRRNGPAAGRGRARRPTTCRDRVTLRRSLASVPRHALAGPPKRCPPRDRPPYPSMIPVRPSRCQASL